MILLVCESSIQIGLDLMCFKFSQILAETGYFPEYWWQTSILFLIGCILAVSNLHFINLAVKYYDATDVVPALSAATMIAEIFAGLIVGGEFHLYNFYEIFWIFISTVICIAGIQVLVMKTSQLSLETTEKDVARESDVQDNGLLVEDRADYPNSVAKKYEAKLITLFTSEVTEDGQIKTVETDYEEILNPYTA